MWNFESSLDFRSLVPDLPQVEVKPIFGQRGAFVNGNMFAGLFGEYIGVKLDPTSRERLAALPGSGPFGPMERPMGGYLSVPPDLDDDAKTPLMIRAYDHVAQFPQSSRRALPSMN